MPTFKNDSKLLSNNSKILKNNSFSTGAKITSYKSKSAKKTSLTHLSSTSTPPGPSLTGKGLDFKKFTNKSMTKSSKESPKWLIPSSSLETTPQSDPKSQQGVDPIIA
jgi:hypothetical protein